MYDDFFTNNNMVPVSLVAKNDTSRSGFMRLFYTIDLIQFTSKPHISYFLYIEVKYVPTCPYTSNLRTYDLPPNGTILVTLSRVCTLEELVKSYK